MTNGFHDDQPTFGHMECPVVPGAVAPISKSPIEIVYTTPRLHSKLLYLIMNNMQLRFIISSIIFELK